MEPSWEKCLFAVWGVCMALEMGSQSDEDDSIAWNQG